MTRLVDMVESLLASDADMRMRMDGRGIEPARSAVNGPYYDYFRPNLATLLTPLG